MLRTACLVFAVYSLICLGNGAGSFMNEPCDDTSNNCLDRHSECRDGKCQCKIGYYYYKQMLCRQGFKDFDEKCKYNEDCKPSLGLECSSFSDGNRLCSCKSGHAWDNTKCVMLKLESLYRTECLTDEDCSVKSNLLCVNNKCSCSGDYAWDGSKCNCRGDVIENSCRVVDTSGNEYVVSGGGRNSDGTTIALVAVGISLVCFCCCGFAIWKLIRKKLKKRERELDRENTMRVVQSEERTELEFRGPMVKYRVDESQYPSAAPTDPMLGRTAPPPYPLNPTADTVLYPSAPQQNFNT